MKKQLVAAVLASVTLAAAVPAFAAANPFVDVPAKHWAYDAVTKLVASGAVDGYGDGTFRGDKTITRYEMAQIVAKALAKSEKMSASDKALADKLAKEFSDELTNLGVRVAALEANQMAVKWGGDLTVINYDQDEADDNFTTFEFRLTADAKVNDDISIKSRITTEEFAISSGTNDVTMDNLYVATNLAGFDVNAGRTDLTLGNGLIYDNTINGAVVSKGKFVGAIGREYLNGYRLGVLAVKDIELGAAKLGLNYLDAHNIDYAGGADITFWGADLAFDLGQLGVVAQYAQSDAAGDPDAVRVDVNLGNSPVTLGYQRIENASVDRDESTLDWIWDTKGWDITYSKDVAKNTTFSLKYSDMESVSTGAKMEKEIQTELAFKF